ncbi:MAG: chlorite dismutase family protein [Patescibacteria group bacterium]|nr:chlorite dismutase family protein [Patescibacteria group bacterium]MDE2588921.1 chlorite dismutase family protein [Patescibacteria group bacterium]
MTYHEYIFFAADKSLQALSKTLRQQYEKEFLAILSQEKNVTFYTYTTLGLKTNTAMLIWFQANSIEGIQELLNELLHSKLGKYLSITYSLFGVIRPSQYSKGVDDDSGRKGGKYLIIYPFTKTASWYMLDFAKRKELMKGHITIGRKYPHITQLLLYSFGLDDQEFIVSYETDDLISFQTLVMDLRSDAVRTYTLRDTPIFTCIYKSPKETLRYL